MKLKQAVYENYRGITEPVEVAFDDTSIFVGRNDAGKSTLLRGLDLFLNNVEALPDIANVFSDSPNCVIELAFDGPFLGITIDETIPTTFADEMLLDEAGRLRVRKEWDTTKSKINPDTYIRRKSFDDVDFLLLTEQQLISRCQNLGIETHKANGEDFNNKEKRTKLREHFEGINQPTSFVWEKLPTSGSTRAKLIHDQVKLNLPRFEYFRADTSLSESDASIQRYFRNVAVEVMGDAGINGVEVAVTETLSEVMRAISDKINRVIPESDQVNPSITFDWSKAIQTGFKSVNDQAALPLTFRGDGFRRVTMMSYFEHLAEERHDDDRHIIFGFEEPETFLHPTAQEQLHEKLVGLEDAGYQVIVTTHSPIVVASSLRSSISHVIYSDQGFAVRQNLPDLQSLANDLGIKPQNQFIKLFEKATVLVLVEGPDDVKAYNFLSQLYKEAGKVENNFEERGILLVPVGGCDSVMHWLNLNILRELNKPFFAVQDSDRESVADDSPTREKLLELGLTEHDDFWVLRKRTLENYLDKQALERLIPGIQIEYDDFTRMKALCGQHSSAIALGGKKVLDKHFQSHTLEEIERSFIDANGEDEFIKIYECACQKL